MNKGELEAKIASYLHRNDLAMDIPGFIELATARIGRDLRSNWNFTVINPTISSVPYVLPDDFRAVRSITTQQDGGPHQLVAMPAHYFNKARGSGVPMWYRIRGRQLEIVPFQARDYEIAYWNTPATLSLGTDTNDVLTQYPYLYTYASLFEAAIFLQDPAMELKFREIYLAETADVNRESASADQGDAPAMRAI